MGLPFCSMQHGRYATETCRGSLRWRAPERPELCAISQLPAYTATAALGRACCLLKDAWARLARACWQGRHEPSYAISLPGMCLQQPRSSLNAKMLLAKTRASPLAERVHWLAPTSPVFAACCVQARMRSHMVVGA